NFRLPQMSTSSMVPPSVGMTWTSFSKVPVTVRSSTDGSRITTISYLRMFWYPPPVVSAATVSPWQEGSCHPARASATPVTDRLSLPAAPDIGQSASQGAPGITGRADGAADQPFIAFLTRANQPPVLRAPAMPPPAIAPAVRPCRRVPQRSQSFRPVMEVYGLPRIFRRHCSQRMVRWCHAGGGVLPEGHDALLLEGRTCRR